MNARTIPTIAFALAVALASDAQAATGRPAGFNVYTVGGDASCTFTSIQDALDAAKAHPGEDDIFVASNLTYDNQHLTITDDDVIIEGGFPSCDVFDNGVATTRLGGTSERSIFEIEGNSHVGIWNFEMTGASLRSDQKGGAIYFGGSGNFSLTNDWIHDNTAGYGAAFAVDASGPTDVFMEANLIIGPNVALVQGGAIRVEGPTTVTAGWNPGQLPIFIGGNSALGSGDIAAGGGIEVIGPASFNGAARIHDNTAAYGGGIAAFAHEGDAATVNLYTTDPGAPVLVSNNTATSIGGGVYIKSSNLGAVATVCANDFTMNENTARNGSALYLDADGGHGSLAYLNSTSCPRPAGAAACATGVGCNDITGNHSTDDGSGTVLVQSNGALYANRFAARGNQGGRLVELVADADVASAIVENCVLADNVMTSNLIWGSGGADATNLFVHNCTLTHNQLGGSDPVIYANVNRLEITGSIIDQAPNASFDFTGSSAQLFTQYVLTNDSSPFTNGLGILAGTPSFADPGQADYHLLRSSLGVDQAPAADPADLDLDGNPRSVDLADIPNDFGPTDLGAYEVQTQLPPAGCVVADTVYCNGFELP